MRVIRVQRHSWVVIFQWFHYFQKWAPPEPSFHHQRLFCCFSQHGVVKQWETKHIFQVAPQTAEYSVPEYLITFCLGRMNLWANCFLVSPLFCQLTLFNKQRSCFLPQLRSDWCLKSNPHFPRRLAERWATCWWSKRINPRSAGFS